MIAVTRPVPHLALLLTGWLPASLMAQEPMPDHAIDLRGRTIRVSDLARLSPGQKTTLGPLVIAQLPAGTDVHELSAERRAILLRRRVPGEDLPLLMQGPVRFRTARGPGRVVKNSFTPPTPRASKGDTLTLAVTSGPVRIERAVEALQTVPKGRAIFVRTADGTVLSAPLAAISDGGETQ